MLKITPPPLQTVVVFCRVIDNFGDAGVCWRLVRQLAAEYDFAVTLWIDTLASLEKIANQINVAQAYQTVEGVVIRHWKDNNIDFVNDDIADVVIEAFGCALPNTYVKKMARRQPFPLWFNLEYLTAESWVEDCHLLPSLHLVLPLTKYFFFPGFSAQTGSLLRERNLMAERQVFQQTITQSAEARADFFAGLGVVIPAKSQIFSLFCYPDAPVKQLFEALSQGAQPTLCLVPEGVAQQAVRFFLQGAAKVGAKKQTGALTVQVLPFVNQPDYDQLLWACDVNFVRGEDSFVRAQWAVRPFVWQIYPQEDGAHWIKLQAFLARYTRLMPALLKPKIEALWQAWNGQGSIQDCIPENIAESGAHFDGYASIWKQYSQQWTQELESHPDLVENLVRCIQCYKKTGEIR